MLLFHDDNNKIIVTLIIFRILAAHLVDLRAVASHNFNAIGLGSATCRRGGL
jgi:hypothetical protein